MTSTSVCVSSTVVCCATIQIVGFKLAKHVKLEMDLSLHQMLAFSHNHLHASRVYEDRLFRLCELMISFDIIGLSNNVLDPGCIPAFAELDDKVWYC